MPETESTRGGFHADVTLRGSLGEDRRTMRVDLFATHTWVSRATADRLGARTLSAIQAETPSGGTIERTLGELEIEIAGRKGTVPVVFGESDDLEAIGRTTLAVLLLEPDLSSSSVSPQPWTHVTQPPLDLEKLDRAISGRMKKGETEAKPKPFWITVTLRSHFGPRVLQFDKDHFDPDFLEGEVRILFNGGSPLIPGSSPLITNEGAVRDVRIVSFFWNLAAACDRLLADSTKEAVLLDGAQSLYLEFERSGRDVDVRLRRAGPIVKRVLATTRLPMNDLAQDIAKICIMTPTLLADKNPEVRGNPVFQRFSKTIQDLWNTANLESP